MALLSLFSLSLAPFLVGGFGASTPAARAATPHPQHGAVTSDAYAVRTALFHGHLRGVNGAGAGAGRRATRRTMPLP